jgi:iron complex outermembrane recepter protein
MNKRTTLPIALVPATVSLLTIAPLPLAQDLQLEEVVVTSQRREQNLQDVPISVSAFTGDALTKNNIKSAIDYLALSPNVSFTEDGQSGARGLGISIRGINNLVSGENAFVNSIGIYLDEFSVASVPNQVANPQLPDMERVEVLRGPQGTYFGRNSLGGALNLTTKKPTDKFEGQVIVGAEDYNNAGEAYNFTGIINMPLSDVLQTRAVLYYEDSDGYVENACKKSAFASSCPVAAENGVTPDGADGSERDALMFRLNTTWNLSDAVSATATIIYSEEEQGTDENVPSGILDLDTVDTFDVGIAWDPGTGFYPNNKNLLSHDLNEETTNESLVGILKWDFEIMDSLVLKSITGFIDAELDRMFDNDLIGGFDALVRTNSYEGFSWSTEFRAEYTHEMFDLVGGILYAQDDQEQENSVAISSNPTATFNGNAVLPPFPVGLGLGLNDKNFEVESIAVFADYTWHASEKMDVVVGARYTRDEVTNEVQGFDIDTDDNCGTTPPCSINVLKEFSGAERSFNDISPRIVVSFQYDNNTHLYGTISKGYKAGGTSVGNFGRTAISIPFDEEIVWNYEAGVKTELLNNRVRLNASVYRLEWSDLQLEAFRFLIPGNLSSNFEQTTNVEEAEATGIEIEFVGAVSEAFTLAGSLGYQDTEITSESSAEITGGFIVQLKGLELPKAPELSTSLAGEYRWEIDITEIWVRLEYIHRDGQFSDVEGLTYKQTTGPSSRGNVRATNGDFPFRSPDYDLFNLRAGYDMERIKFGLYIQNLTDKEYYTGTQENFGLSGIRLRPHPRIVGGTIRYSF